MLVAGASRTVVDQMVVDCRAVGFEHTRNTAPHFLKGKTDKRKRTSVLISIGNGEDRLAEAARGGTVRTVRHWHGRSVADRARGGRGMVVVGGDEWLHIVICSCTY